MSSDKRLADVFLPDRANLLDHVLGSGNPVLLLFVPLPREL